jgi:uracil-DNA glycosylase family 4
VSFWFAKQAKKQARQGPQKAVGGPKRGIDTLHRLGCKACPLNNTPVHTPKMPPTLGKVGGIYFLAEAPGAVEDKNGAPLIGPSGQLLRSCIPDNHERDCSFDNCVRDRPEGNRTPVWQEIECCRGHVTRSIEDQKPRLIIGLGAVPLSWFLGSTDISGMRGRLFAVKVGQHCCWFLPTFHPSFVLRTARNKSRPLNSKFGHCFRMDIDHAFEILPKLSPPSVTDSNTWATEVKTFDGATPEQFAALGALIKRAQKARLLSIDLETSCLRPYSKDARILTVAISTGEAHFSFAVDHPKAEWESYEKADLLEGLREILASDSIKVAHNVPFELEWLICQYGHEIARHDVWECTMMQAHLLDERKGKQTRYSDNRRAAYQSLGFLVRQYFGYDYKKDYKLDKRNMAEADLSTTLTYNAIDAKAALMLYHRQHTLLEQHGLMDAYVDALPRQCSVALMQWLGMPVNQNQVKALQKQLGDQIKAINFNINNLKVVKQFIADRKEFNPQSERDVLAIFKDYLKRPEVKVTPKQWQVRDFDRPPTTKRGEDQLKERLSVDKNVLEQIDHPLAKLITELRNKAKLKSTYCDNLDLTPPPEWRGKSVIFPDGKLHTSFNTTFTETGRTSSDEPNMQNFPKRVDGWVRKQVVAPPGHVILAFDYGQLEACTTAMCSRDPYLVKALCEDYDTHMEWALKILHHCPEVKVDRDDPKAMKRLRSLTKNKLTFPAFFGAANESVRGYLSTALKIDIHQSHVDDLMDEFWGTFTGVKRWQDRTMAEYYEKGWCATPNGRRHRYPLTRNQVVNMPIQGLASDIECLAMNRLSYKALTEKNWNIHPRINLHDDLTFIALDDDDVLEQTIIDVYTIMLTPDYPCVNVPLSVECSIGKNWHEMSDIGKFWSHKDLQCH